MAMKVCSSAIRNAGDNVNVGELYDSTHFYVTRYASNFADADDPNYQRNVINTGGVYATPRALTQAESGSTILVNDAAGLDFTLPAVAAGQVGTFYRFYVTATVTSNNFRVTAASGDFLNGAVWIADFDTANTGAYFAADGTSNLVMTMNGSTKGGKKGTVVEFEAISATGWMVTGIQVFGDGSLATPFS